VTQDLFGPLYNRQ